MFIAYYEPKYYDKTTYFKGSVPNNRLLKHFLLSTLK